MRDFLQLIHDFERLALGPLRAQIGHVERGDVTDIVVGEHALELGRIHARERTGVRRVDIGERVRTARRRPPS